MNIEKGVVFLSRIAIVSASAGLGAGGLLRCENIDSQQVTVTKRQEQKINLQDREKYGPPLPISKVE